MANLSVVNPSATTGGLQQSTPTAQQIQVAKNMLSQRSLDLLSSTGWDSIAYDAVLKQLGWKDYTQITDADAVAFFQQNPQQVVQTEQQHGNNSNYLTGDPITESSGKVLYDAFLNPSPNSGGAGFIAAMAAGGALGSAFGPAAEIPGAASDAGLYTAANASAAQGGLGPALGNVVAPAGTAALPVAATEVASGAALPAATTAGVTGAGSAGIGAGGGLFGTGVTLPQAAAGASLLGTASTLANGGGGDSGSQFYDAFGNAYDNQAAASAADNFGAGSDAYTSQSQIAEAGGIAQNNVPTGWDAFKTSLPAGLQQYLGTLNGPALAGIAGALMGGTQGKAADLSTTTTPWGPAQAGILQGVGNAQNLLTNNSTFTPPPRPAVPDYQPAYTDQYLNDAIMGAVRPMTDTYANTIMPAIGSSSMGNGQFGSSRQAIAEALASGKLLQGVGDTSSQLMNQFSQNRAANILGTNTLNSDNMWKGTAYDYKSAQDQYQAPWNAATTASNIFTQAGGQGKTTNTPMPDTPWWQTAIAGAGSFADAYSKLFPKA